MKIEDLSDYLERMALFKEIFDNVKIPEEWSLEHAVGYKNSSDDFVSIDINTDEPYTKNGIKNGIKYDLWTHISINIYRMDGNMIIGISVNDDDREMFEYADEAAAQINKKIQAIKMIGILEK